MVDVVKAGRAATAGVGAGRAALPADPQRWADEQERVTVLSPDLSTTLGRGRVAAYHPASVTVRQGNGNMVQVPLERVVPLDAADAQTEFDDAVVEVLGGGAGARARYAALLAAGYTVSPPPG